MWFRLYAMHGGGHQGDSEHYVWRPRRPSANEREEMWKEWVDRSYLHNAKGGVTLVRKLPEKVRQEKIEDYRRTIKHAQEMLGVLGEDKGDQPVAAEVVQKCEARGCITGSCGDCDPNCPCYS